MVSRVIGNEPEYTCRRPLYGLFVFGKATRVWAVFDKSNREGRRYDVLYFDRNADGNLTNPDERILAKIGVKDQPLQFHIGKFNDPNTKQVHTEVVVVNYEEPVKIMGASLKWNGTKQIFCGLTSRPPKDWRHQFSPDRRTAPVFFIGTSGPLTFLRSPPDRGESNDLEIGTQIDLKVAVGIQGIGTSTFSAIDYSQFRENVTVIVTLEYESTDGKRRRFVTKLRERC